MTQFVEDFKMVNIESHWLVDSVDYFKVDSRKLLFNILNNIFSLGMIIVVAKPGK